MKTTIRQIQQDDLVQLDKALSDNGITRRSGYFQTCLDENKDNRRLTLIAYKDNDIAGFCSIINESKYCNFKDKGIPEINDLLVFENYRKSGIAEDLLKAIERQANARFSEIGLGVGLYKDYGPAQKLYAKNGYKPDGKGIHYKYNPIEPGQKVTLDDDLLIFITKRL